jgi:hypothetical protein
VETYYREKSKNSKKKTCPSATKNPTWADPGANPGLPGKRPTTNLLGHDTAYDITIKLLRNKFRAFNWLCENQDNSGKVLRLKSKKTIILKKTMLLKNINLPSATIRIKMIHFHCHQTRVR